MQWLYRLAFLPLLILASPYYLRRMLRRGGYGRHFGQRFGDTVSLPPKRPGVNRIWIQAVSVGELLAIEPLIRRLEAGGRSEIYLTTTTSTGFAVANEKYTGRTIGVGYFPLDFWLFSRRAWSRVRPDIAVLTESELWPEHLWQARRRGVPVILVNGRLSDRSYRRMSKVRGLVNGVLGRLTRVLASSVQDAERFRALGAEPARVDMIGNIKVDFDPGAALGEAEKRALRAELGLGGESELLLLGSSTWPGEEEVLVEALRKARAAGIACRLLLVPRHAERRGEVVELLRRGEFSYHLRSRGRAPADVDIAIGDTTGELRCFLQLADLVVVGKSLPPHKEGQTPVEAAAFGRPIVFGPGMSNFRAIASTLEACGAARRVADADALITAVVALLPDGAARVRMGDDGRKWHEANRGAVEKAVRAIEHEMRFPAATPAGRY